MTDNTTTGASKEALFCIGSNTGDRVGNVATALVWLAGRLEDFRHSHIYATPDCHGGDREYLNAVCGGWTSMGPTELERICKEYELAQGRDATARARGDVPVDVDLIVYDGKILRKRDFGSEYFRIGYQVVSCKL